MKKAGFNIMHNKPGQTQKGAVLIVSLLVLMVLTLIGISTLDSSIMEEKMASNAQTSTTVFQAAESAIREKYYEEDTNPPMAVEHARLAETSTPVTSGEITHNTQMTLTGKTYAYNYSAGIFEGRGIEISGNASMRRINDKHTQGYSVYPMRP